MINKKKVALAGVGLYSSFLLPMVAAADVKEVNVYYSVKSELTTEEQEKVIAGTPDKYCHCGSAMVYVYQPKKAGTGDNSKPNNKPGKPVAQKGILPSTGDMVDVLPIVAGSFVAAAVGVYVYRKKGSKGLKNLLAITVVGGSLMSATYADAYSKEGALSKYNTSALVSDKPAPAEIEGYEYVGYFKDESQKVTTKQVTTKVVLEDAQGNVIENDAAKEYFSNAFGKTPFTGDVIYKQFQNLYATELASSMKEGTSSQALDWKPAAIESKTYTMEPVVTTEALTETGEALFNRLKGANATLGINMSTPGTYYKTQLQEFSSYAELETTVRALWYGWGADQKPTSFNFSASADQVITHTTTGSLTYTVEVSRKVIDDCTEEVTYTVKVVGDYELKTDTPTMLVVTPAGTTTDS